MALTESAVEKDIISGSIWRLLEQRVRGGSDCSGCKDGRFPIVYWVV